MFDYEIVEALRRKLGLSVLEFAEAVKVPAPLLELWAAGRTKPRAAFWRSVCELLARRGIVALETEAEALDRSRRDREASRSADIARRVESMRAAHPSKRRK